MKNVLVTGADTPLGQQLIVHLHAREGVEQIVGIERQASSSWVDDTALVTPPPDQSELVSRLVAYPIDTVIHCNLAPDRNGSVSGPERARVIETMRLGAALASAGVSVRSWVIASSSGVYPVDCTRPLLNRESGEVDAREDTPAAAILEAEDYARDVAARCPHMNVALMRLQYVVGDGFLGPMTALLEQGVLPNVIGYDAPLQMLDARDATRALAFAAENELAGVYNVASAGTIRSGGLGGALGKPSLPVLPVEAPGALGRLARRLGAPHVPRGLLWTLCFGHALDTAKLSAAGFDPEYDQRGCVDSFGVPNPGVSS